MTEASADLKNLQALLHTAVRCIADDQLHERAWPGGRCLTLSTFLQASRLAYVTKLLESCGENERKELQEEMVLFESELRRIHDASEAGKDIQVTKR